LSLIRNKENDQCSKNIVCQRLYENIAHGDQDGIEAFEVRKQDERCFNRDPAITLIAQGI